ncbi:MAG: nucleotidyltransferase family protein [Cyanobacteria bacterium P01_H01_bin.21]
MKTLSKKALFKDMDARWTFSTHPTIQLLLCCISPNTDHQTVDQIKTLGEQSVDWTALIDLAKQHRLETLLHSRLMSICPTLMPKALRDDLQTHCQAIARRNLFVTSELVRLLTLMESKGVDTLPYKGPVLAQTLYKNLNLRQFGDLDIIIRPQDMYAVESLLIEEGYRPYFGKKSKTELEAYMKSPDEHSYDFRHDGKSVFIEMHWRFWPTTFSSVNPREVWDRRQPIAIAGKTVSNMTVEDYLIILCMHGSRHVWQRLAWLGDIATLLHNYPELDWSQVMQQANQWGSRRMLYLGLYLAHHWLTVPLPSTVMEQLNVDSTLPALATQVDRHIFQSGQSFQSLMATTRYQIQVRERWCDKGTYIRSFVKWLLKGCP